MSSVSLILLCRLSVEVTRGRKRDISKIVYVRRKGGRKAPLVLHDER